jgi:3-deoxy-D-manno-octulosonic acid kinase
MEWARWGCRQTGFRYILFERDTPETLLSLWRKPLVGKSGSSANRRGEATYLRHEGREYVHRHYYRGGWPARWVVDRYFWLGLKRSRPWREMALLAEMRHEGLPVPPPVLAVIDRTGFWGYRADLVTARLDGTSLAQAIRSAQPIDWTGIGRTIRRFHDLGIEHADLNATNIWLTPKGEVCLLDFDRARRRHRRSRYFSDRSLRRLRRSLEKQPGGAAEAEAWDVLIRRGYVPKPPGRPGASGSGRRSFRQFELHGENGPDPPEHGSGG